MESRRTDAGDVEPSRKIASVTSALVRGGKQREIKQETCLTPCVKTHMYH